MTDSIWISYTATEDDCIEYHRCAEVLGEMGFADEEIDSIALKCSVCCLFSRCSVPGKAEFMGARTC